MTSVQPCIEITHTRDPKIGIGILILNEYQQILLGKRLVEHGYGMWSPPGGHLEYGETFEECARREIYEETGLSIEEPLFQGITNTIFKNEEKHYVCIFMKVTLRSKQIPQNREPHKTEKWIWFNLNDLPLDLFLPFDSFIKKNKSTLLFND